MGIVFKLLLVFIALSWIFSKLMGFFLRSKLKQFVAHSDNLQKEEQRRKRPADGNVNVDFVPSDFKERKSKEIRGGDYVDYEEVKD